MKLTGFTCSLLLIVLRAHGQNLVVNPDFETYSACPTSASQVANATGWSNARQTLEYFNSCSSSNFGTQPTNYFGFQAPASGQAYVGGLMYGSFAGSYIADIREFLFSTLSTPLTIGTTYYVSFKVVLADNSGYAVNNIGAQFCTGFTANFPLNNTAHVYTTSVISDKTNWVTITGSFVPAQAYDAIMIGNFFTDANSTPTFVGTSVNIGYNAYYLIDDIYVGLTAPLAITLEELSAENAGDENILYWKTESEASGDRFEIERSADAKAFKTIAAVDGSFPNGGAYQFTDEAPVAGINYYRLKMTDSDGRIHYSDIVSAQVHRNGPLLHVFPNPVNDLLTVSTSCPAYGNAIVTLTDASGTIMRSIVLEGTSASVDLQELEAGYYLLRYRDDVTSETVKVVKQ